MSLQNKILVTGSAGLVGKELVSQLLQQGNSVIALYHQTPLDINHVNLQKVQCDLLDVVTLEEAMKDIDYVYHCAGLVNFTSDNKKKLYKINVEATANVINASLHSGVKKLVHVSSVAALGRMRENVSIDENMQWTVETGGSVYGYTKYLGELEVWRGIAEGLNAVIVNPSIILGAGNWNDGSTAIFKKVLNGLNWYTEGITGFVDVRDVCKAMILLMKSDIESNRFILNAENSSFKEVLFQIADCFKINRPAKKANSKLSEIVWRLESIRCFFTRKEPLITKETAQAALAKVNFDNSKFINLFPDFKYYTLKETIENTCQILKKNG